MIYVTQGHEKGVGLEIFLKSIPLLPISQQKNITLVANETNLNKNLSDLKISTHLLKDVHLLSVPSCELPSSTTTLLAALKVIKSNDILITLPTSKDQLLLEGRKVSGYTEFFRAFYNDVNISMIFKGIDQNILLITDHIPLKDVSSFITKDLIISKTNKTINLFKKYFFSFEEIIFSGINPHAGEGGLLGLEDQLIDSAINELEKKYGDTIKFRGPFSGDTLHMYESAKRKQLLVYMFHDQGLAKFKSHHGLIGLNVSLGLPFLRLSVDHGTAFELYGKNQANISSMMFLLKQAFEVINHVH